MISVLTVSHSHATEFTDGGRILGSNSPPIATIDVRYIRFQANDAVVETDRPVILGAASGSSFSSGFENVFDANDSISPIGLEVYKRTLHFGSEYIGGFVNLELSADITGTWNWDGGALDDGSYFEDFWFLAINDIGFGGFLYNADNTAIESSSSGSIFIHGISSATNAPVTFTDEIKAGNYSLNEAGSLVLEFTGATSHIGEVAEISAVATYDVPDTYIYEIDISAGITTVGASLSLQIKGTNSGSLTSITGNTNVTEVAPGSGWWDITFLPAANVSDVLELRILEGISFTLELTANSYANGSSTSTSVSSATWLDGTIVE
jgi:hypothetical protein